MKTPQELRKLLLAKQSLPDGYGRSVVGGKELITAPSKPTMDQAVSSQSSRTLHNEDDYNDAYSSSRMDDSSESEDDMEGIVELGEPQVSDAKLFNGFRPEDLVSQYKIMLEDHSGDQSELDRYLSEEDDVNEKKWKLGTYKKDGKPMSKLDEEDTIRYLANAVRYGRSLGE